MIILQILRFAVLNFHVLANSVECVVSHGLVFMLIGFQTILHESKSVCLLVSPCIHITIQ